MLVLLSGEMAAGKTSVAELLTSAFDFVKVGTGDRLRSIARDLGLKPERSVLQNLGDELDKQTQGDWVVDLALDQMRSKPESRKWVLDSVRRDFQVERFRLALRGEVVHVHLICHEGIVKERFSRRSQLDPRDIDVAYEVAKSSATEQHARELFRLADISVNSGQLAPLKVAESVDAILKVLSGGEAE